MAKVILFLNENPLPPVFTQGAIAGKELRLRAAIPEIDQVHVICRRGKTVAIPNPNRGPLEQKIVIHRLPACPYYLATPFLFVYGCYFAWKLRPVVIEAESPILSGPAAAVIGWLFRRPVIVEMRASYHELIKVKVTWIPYPFKRFCLNLIQNFSFTHAHAIIANSHFYQVYLDRMGYKSTVINPGIQYPPSTLHRQTTSKTIGYLGRLVPEKGALHLIEAIIIIQKLLKQKGWRVEIAGDGPLKSQLKKRVEDAGLGNLIKITGIQPPFHALSAYAFLVNPCYVKAPLEMVNAEAASMQVPVICYGNPQIPETVAHNRTGLKVPESDIQALAAAIKQLVVDASLRKKLGTNGPEFVRHHYDFQLQVTRLRRLYHQRLAILQI